MKRKDTKPCVIIGQALNKEKNCCLFLNIHDSTTHWPTQDRTFLVFRSDSFKIKVPFINFNIMKKIVTSLYQSGIKMNKSTWTKHFYIDVKAHLSYMFMKNICLGRKAFAFIYLFWPKWESRDILSGYCKCRQCEADYFSFSSKTSCVACCSGNNVL